MKYFELPEYASLALAEGGSDAPLVGQPDGPSPLQQLVARLHRHAVAPRGYRFVVNLAASDEERALRAIRQVAIASELRLESKAVDEAGNPVPQFALYIRSHLPEPQEFWTAFRANGQPDLL